MSVPAHQPVSASTSDETQPYAVESEPWPERDGCLVRVRIARTWEIVFSVSDILVHRRELASEVAVDWRPLDGGRKEGRGIPVRALARQGVNWRSSSSVDSLARRLAAYYEVMSLPWKVVVEWAAGGVDEHVRRPLDLEDPEWVADPVGLYRVWPLIPDSGVVVWFGPGDSGKGLMACVSLFVLAYGHQLGPLALRERVDGRWYYVDYEDSKREWDARLTRIATGADVYLPGNVQRVSGRAPFSELAHGLVERIGPAPGGLIIDSALAATGGDIKEPEPVRQFFNACHRFDCPIVVIAHETKLENDYYPFGSVFWHNLARQTVNFRSALRTPLARQVLLRSRKRNNGVTFSDQAVELSFSNDEAGEMPAWTRLRQISLGSLVGELAEKRSLAQRLEQLLLSEPDQTTAELAETLEAIPDSVKKALRRGNHFIPTDGGTGRGHAARWRVLGPSSPGPGEGGHVPL